MKLTIGFSPCPNDTFIFDALINRKIPTGGLEFDAVLEDVETLNKWAIRRTLDISKISYGVLPLVLKEYLVLQAGGALGMGVGPLLIANRQGITSEDIINGTIAIPGEHTTAHMLFSLAYPQAHNKQFLVFNEIEQAVLEGRADAGVIIHENRFTYQQKGLIKIKDLGQYWEETTKNPIPLGGIIMKRNYDHALQQQVDLLIRQSVEYAFSHYPELSGYVTAHAQEMSEEVMRQHINLYVNHYSIGLEAEGQAAVNRFLEIYRHIHNIPLPEERVFL